MLMYQTTIILYFLNFFCITSSFLFYQVVKSFTHFNQSGNHSIIDLAFVSSPFLLNFCNTIPPLSTSDHHGFILSFHSNVVSRRPSTSTRRTVWCYAQADFDLACELLDHTDWNSLCTEAHAGCQPTLVSVAVQVLQCYGAMYTSESPPYSKASSLA